MKSVLPYIVVFSVSLLLVTAVMAGLIKFSPATLGLSGNAAPADSTHKTGTDSLAAAKEPDSRAHDSAAVTESRPVRADTSQPQAESKPGKSASELPPPAEQPKQAQNVDTTAVKKQPEIAKYFDSMNAESAAKILNSMTDDEIKDVLAKVKKRQAAKILTLLEPSRAVRVLR
jgi:hypothetical protein